MAATQASPLAEFERFLEYEGNRKFEEGFNKKDVTLLKELFTEDARILAPDHPLISTKDMDAFLSQVWSKGGERLRIRSKEIIGPAIGNRIAVVVDRRDIEVMDAKGVAIVHTKAVATWKKVGENWKIDCYCWNWNHSEPVRK